MEGTGKMLMRVDVDAFDAVVNNGEHDPTGGRAYFKADLWDEDWIDTNEAPGKENTEKKADVDAGYSGELIRREKIWGRGKC